jgi:hypothetical protein
MSILQVRKADMERKETENNQLMVMPEKEVGNYLYRKAIAYAREKNIYESLMCYVDAFLLGARKVIAMTRIGWISSALSSSFICWGRNRYAVRCAKGT